MKYNKIKDINVSEIGFGGEWLLDKNTDEIKEVIDASFENGVNFFDCWIVDPSIRKSIGEALKGKRENWVIQGHLGAVWKDDQYLKTRDVNLIKDSFEELLEYFYTDYIDFAMIHYVDTSEDYYNILDGEFMEYAKSLKDTGKVKHIGISTHNPVIGIKAAENPDIELIMFSVNPLYDMFSEVELTSDYHDKEKFEGLAGVNPLRREFYDKCLETDTSISVMKAYAGGRLLNKDDSPFGVALSTVQCIEYALTRPGVKSVLLGLKDVKELEEALLYESASDLDKDFNKVLKDAPLHSFENKCIYCGHCSPCTQSINIAKVNKYYDLACLHDSVPDTVKAHYLELDSRACDCIKCGECLSRCPFGVDIIDYMSKACKLLE